MVAFGHRELDSLLGPDGLEPGQITLLVGEAGTGKTSLALVLASGAKHPHIVDTEGISLERIRQVGAEHAKIARVTDFERQQKIVGNIEEGCDLLILDSLVMLYRLERAERPEEASAELARHMADLVELAEKEGIPVVVTGHIYEWEGKKRIVSGDVAKYWAKTIVQLEKLRRPGERRAVLLKHPHRAEGKKVRFKICGTGVC